MFKTINSNILCVLTLILFYGCATSTVDPLSGKTFRIIKVNDYFLPKDAPSFKAKFKDGGTFLIETCNPTWGRYEVIENSLMLSAMGNFGRNACVELFEADDGSMRERLAKVPSVITEEEFMSLGDSIFKIKLSQSEVHFIDENGNTSIILEQYR